MDKYYYLKNNPRKHSSQIILDKQVRIEIDNERKIEDYKSCLREGGDSLGHNFNNHSNLLEDSDLKEWTDL